MADRTPHPALVLLARIGLSLFVLAVSVGLFTGLAAGIGRTWAVRLVVGGGLVGIGFTWGWFAQLRGERRKVRVLGYLLLHRDTYALDLVAARLGDRGTIYVRLGELQEDGLVEWSLEEFDPADVALGVLPRRRYRATSAGCAAVVAACARGPLRLPDGTEVRLAMPPSGGREVARA